MVVELREVLALKKADPCAALRNDNQEKRCGMTPREASRNDYQEKRTEGQPREALRKDN